MQRFRFSPRAFSLWPMAYLNRSGKMPIDNNSSLLVKNIDYLVTMDESRRVIEDGWLLAKGNRIAALGAAGQQPPEADQVLDANGHIVLPGLINTHHHFYQNLLRALPSAQNFGLFGYLKELYYAMGSLTNEMLHSSSLAAMAELMLSGCTTTSDHSYLHVNDIALDTQIDAARQLGMRFHLCRGSMTVGQSGGGLSPDEIVEDEDEVLADTERLAKTYHDTQPGAMVRIAVAPCSVMEISARLMRECASLARRYGLGLHTHLAETQDDVAYCLERFGKRPVQFAADVGWTGPDTWLAHCVHVNPEEIALLADTKTGVAYLPGANMRLGSGIAPIRDMLAKGVRVGLGVDGSSSNDSSHLLGEARRGMFLQRVRYGANCLTATQVLEMATLGGASLLQRDDLAVLAPGMVADLIGFDLNQLHFVGAMHDPVAALVFCEPGQVSFSVINGKVVVEDGRIAHLDLPTMIRRHNELSKEIVNRSEARYGHDLTSLAWRRIGESVPK
jgi:cytosine/adenosine deaminase-related metal-dependent hydrolase